ncbi:MAG TPA: GNAT family N-acetyltransferase [Nocardioidaceae bacterium]|nr:GNAT family N-acetyltransferase [Nocardioidaceae bacterium]
MRIEQVDPLALDEATAAELADIENREASADDTESSPANGASLRARVRHTPEGPYAGLWIAADDTGRPVGHASLELSRWDNLDTGLVFCHVDPAHRRQGVGTALLAAQSAAVRAAGRHRLLTFAFRNSPAEALLLQDGWRVGQHTAQRRLDVPGLDYADISALAADARKHAADYELVRLEGPLPDEWLPELQALSEAINDAPLDDLDLEPDAFPPERLRATSDAMVARRQHGYRLFARHRASGDWAAHTILYVDELRPGVANQEDTSVVGVHRGHRLGMLLKAEMLLWLHDEEPQLRSIDTWNAETNAHMIAINDRLGCRVINRGSVMQGPA